MKIGKRREGGSRGADLHRGAGCRIEHLGGDHDDQAGPHLDRSHKPASTMLNTFKAYATTEMLVPAIVNHAILPDMGRMNARLRSTVRTISSWTWRAAAKLPSSPTP